MSDLTYRDTSEQIRMLGGLSLSFDALDLFAGPGGWDEGARLAGVRTVGIEWDADACRTAKAAGHARVRADVSAYPPEAFRGGVRGLIASPPCTAFSMAGKGEGRAEIAHLHRAVEDCRDGWTDPGREWADATAPLVLEPLRWAWALRGDLDWIACEQVPPVLELWRHMADVLRGWGYDADARRLSAEQYGVPQTRRRAILLAHRERVRWPKPTHQRYRPGEAAGAAEECRPGLFGAALLPWVSMAEALGWAAGTAALNPGKTDAQPNRRTYPLSDPAPAVGFGHDAANWRWQLHQQNSFGGKSGNIPRPSDEPSPAVGSRADLWRLRAGTNDHDTSREAGEPVPTLRFGQRLNAVDWVRERPATTVPGSWLAGAGEDRGAVIAPPGHRDWSEHGASRQDAEGVVRITVQQAAVLQSFPPDYPWQGSKTSVFRQVGNCVPPLLAAHIVAALTDTDNDAADAA